MTDLVTNALHLQHQWAADILMLPDELFAHDATAKSYLLETAWRQSAPLRGQALFPHSLAFRAAADRDLTEKKAADIVRHVIDVINGDRPVFAPVLDDSDLYGPFRWYQEYLIRRFPKDRYFPHIVIPQMLGKPTRAGFVLLNRRFPAFHGVYDRDRAAHNSYGDLGMSSYAKGMPMVKDFVPKAIHGFLPTATAKLRFLCKERAGKKAPLQWTDDALALLDRVFALPTWATTHGHLSLDHEAAVLRALIYISLK